METIIKNLENYLNSLEYERDKALIIFNVLDEIIKDDRLPMFYGA